MSLIEIERALFDPPKNEDDPNSKIANSRPFAGFIDSLVKSEEIKYSRAIAFRDYITLTPDDLANPSIKGKLPTAEEMGTYIELEDKATFYVREPYDSFKRRLSDLGVPVGEIPRPPMANGKKKSYGFKTTPLSPQG
jgi:hypothetical protein